MKKFFLAVTFVLATSGLLRAESAETEHCGEDYKLYQLKSIAVFAGLAAHSELNLSSKELRVPFEERLKKRGITLNGMNEGSANHVMVNLSVTRFDIKGAFFYIANISATYNEYCVTDRTKHEARCVLWEYYEPAEIFSSPSAAKKHVLSVLEKAATQFMEAFERSRYDNCS